MKKHFGYIVITFLLLTSCNQGSVSGYVTYQLSEFGSKAVDQYAEVYITKKNVDTIVLFLDAVKFKEQISETQKNISRTNDTDIIDSLKRIISTKNNELGNITNKISFKELANASIKQLLSIKEDNKISHKEVVDNEGMYSSPLQPDCYNFVFVSEKIRKENILERRGKVIVQKNRRISPQKSIRLNVNFR